MQWCACASEADAEEKNEERYYLGYYWELLLGVLGVDLYVLSIILHTYYNIILVNSVSRT